MIDFLNSIIDAGGDHKATSSADQLVLDAYSRTISSVATTAGDAVVQIRITKNNGRRNNGGGVGSGFIISSDGFVVTNHHVVAGAKQIQVLLQDGRNLAAKRCLSGLSQFQYFTGRKYFDQLIE